METSRSERKARRSPPVICSVNPNWKRAEAHWPYTSCPPEQHRSQTRHRWTNCGTSWHQPNCCHFSSPWESSHRTPRQLRNSERQDYQAPGKAGHITCSLLNNAALLTKELLWLTYSLCSFVQFSCCFVCCYNSPHQEERDVMICSSNASGYVSSMWTVVPCILLYQFPPCCLDIKRQERSSFASYIARGDHADEHIVERCYKKEMRSGSL